VTDFYALLAISCNTGLSIITLQGAALGAMVGFLTYGNKKFHHLDAQMRSLLEPLYRTMKQLIPFIDADAAAFNDYMVRPLSSLCSTK